MPLPYIPLAILQEKNQLATIERFAWLYEVTVPTTPNNTIYRLTRQPESISFQGQTYSPFPISHSVVTRDNSGDLPTIQLQVSNISREIIGTMENHNGLVGQRVLIRLVNSVNFGDDAVPVAEESFVIQAAGVDRDRANFTLGGKNLLNAPVPKSRMTRFHCRHQYRSAACGYSLDPSDANYIATCDKSLEGANGCAVHGDSYTAAGLTPIHPQRFGGFPGIPVEGAGGAL